MKKIARLVNAVLSRLGLPVTRFSVLNRQPAAGVEIEDGWQQDHLPDGQDDQIHSVYSEKIDFTSQSEFNKFMEKRPELFSEKCEKTIVEHCRQHGAWNHIIGTSTPEDVQIIGPEMREHLMISGLNSRQRAVLNEVVDTYLEQGLTVQDVRIYGHEAITPLALIMRGVFPRYLGTEYGKTVEEQGRLWPIPHGNVCRSDLPDGRMDIIMSCDVFEHVPDIDAALNESYRILRSGGRFIATFPFLLEQQESRRMARLSGEAIEHLILPPEYHGNPVDPEGGSLVFEFPAWDILDRARAAGFSKTRMRLVINQHRGIVASGVFSAIKVRGVMLALFDK